MHVVLHMMRLHEAVDNWGNSIEESIEMHSCFQFCSAFTLP